MRQVVRSGLFGAVLLGWMAGAVQAGAATASITKSIAATSEAATVRVPQGGIDAFDVAVGETVTFRLESVLPESTAISLRLGDVLAPEFARVPGSERVSYVANTLPSFNGDFAGIQNESTPTVAFPANRVSFDAGSSTLAFDFGSIINNDGDADNELLIVEFDVVVRDDPASINGAIVSNEASLVIDEGLPTETIGRSEVVRVRVVEPVIRASKVFAPDVLVRGATTTITLTATNLAIDGATAPAQDLVLTDLLDDWLDVDSVSVAFNTEAATFGSTAQDQSVLVSGFSTGVRDQVDVRISGLPINGTATVTVGVQVDPNADPLLLARSIANTLDVAADSLASDAVPDDDDRAYTATASDDLDIVKPTLLLDLTDSPDPIAAGAAYAYTATLQNSGTPTIDATGVVLTMQVPAGFGVNTATPSQGSCGALSAGQVSCSLGTLAAGASASLVLSGVVPASTTAGSIANMIAWATSNEGNHGNDGNDTPTDNDDERAEEPTTVLREVDVSIQKSASDTTPAEGEPFTFDLVVGNNGPSDASNVIVTDALPADLSFISFAPANQPCTYTAPTLTCTLPALAAGDSTTITVQASANAGTAGSTITNTASVTTTEPESNTGNNSGSISVIPEARNASVSIDKSGIVDFGPDGMASVGDSIQYGFTLTNGGNTTLSGLTISDALLPVITCPGGHPITSLAPGAEVDCSGAYALTQADVDTGRRDNVATLVANDGGGTLTDTDTHQVTYTPFADLSLSKTVDTAVALSGQTVVFTLTLANAGPGAANATTVVDTLPNGLAWVSDTCAAGPGSGPQLTWSVGMLAAGASASCQITTRVTVNTRAALVNTASASSTTADPTPAQTATASATLTAIPAAHAIPVAGAGALLGLILLMLGATAIALRRP